MRIFRLVIQKYVDDFFGAQSKRSWTCANKFMKIIMAGFGLDLDPKKCEGFMDVIVILGAEIEVNSARLVVTIGAAPDKVARWLADIETYLSDSRLTPSYAMKLVGGLQWALAIYTNRCGRAYCKPLHAAIHSPMPDFVLSLWCRRALLWFRFSFG